MTETGRPALESASGQPATIARRSTDECVGAANTAASLPPVWQDLGGMLACVDGGPRTVRFDKNCDVVIAGNAYDCFYANHDGWLVRYKILHKGGRQIIDLVLPGDIFGLQACLFKRSLHSIATVTPATLTVVPCERIDRAFERNPDLSLAMFLSATREAARLAEHLTDAGRRSAYERLGHLILELFVRLRTVGLTSGMSFHLPLTQELIGDALGLTTIHVNRTLQRLRQDNLIALEARRVTILDFKALSLLCDFEASYLGDCAPGPHSASESRCAAPES